jgi:hypothetical protein
MAAPATEGMTSPAGAAQAEASAQAPRDASSHSNAMAKSMAPAKPQESLGTGHGARETAPVTYTEFVRESSRPNEIVSMYYDSHQNLVERGIIRVPRQDPQPFPNQFVPDPDR